jgi:PAS domain S-box-containing protein
MAADESIDEPADALIVVSPAGKVLAWNRGAKQMFGFTPAEAIGRLLVDVVPPRMLGEEPLTLRAALENGSSVGRMQGGKNGATVEVSMRAVRDGAGGVSHIAIRMKPAAQVDPGGGALVEPLLRGLLEGAPDAMMVLDEDGRILFLNREAQRQFQYSADELIGQGVDGILPPNRRRAADPSEQAGDARDSSVPSGGEGLVLRARRKDGSEFPAAISLCSVGSDGGTLIAIAVRDVTAHREVPSALELAAEELKAIRYSLAHDLRAPLHGMDSFAQGLLDEYGDRLGPGAVSGLRGIRSNAARLGALVETLLTVSQVAECELRCDQVELAALARAAAAAWAAAEPNRAVELVVEEPLQTWADPLLARTLIENLLGNAWNTTRNVDGPRIEVGALDLDGARIFFVRDNGIGFDPEQAARLFAPVRRIQMQRELDETGVGLAMAQRIVRRHGGTIWAESAVGQGATFYFTLPAPDAPPPPRGAG